MSRLDSRLREFERRLGRCRECQPTLELVQANERSRRRPPPVQYCPCCRAPIERIEVLVCFDPKLGSEP
jgi:hypothetical protein